jgi:hypothetical protein
MKKIIGFCLVLAAFAGGLPTALRADEVTDWNTIMFRAVTTAPATPPIVTTRVVAIVHGAIYDAVNGIERRYQPLHVDFDAPLGASRRAAAVQAAYATLYSLYTAPAIRSILDTERANSLAAIAEDHAAENSQSIARGIEWGQTVADDILAWRSTDGFTPDPAPFLGGPNPGEWRPTPRYINGGPPLPGNFPQFAYMTTWVIDSHSSFQPGPPPPIDSAAYALDFNEVKSKGRDTSTTRTAEEKDIALFWLNNTASYWNRVAQTLAAERHNTLSENSRLFAILNVSMADAGIACWDAKYTYVYWRPVTAIQLADTDGNADTVKDDSWRPLIDTPNHPEYLSGHSTVSGAAAQALANYFGDASPFDLNSGGTPDVIHHYDSLSQASKQIADARVFAGIHFRTACNVGRAKGEAVANYIAENAFNPLNGKKKGQTAH